MTPSRYLKHKGVILGIVGKDRYQRDVLGSHSRPFRTNKPESKSTDPAKSGRTQG